MQIAAIVEGLYSVIRYHNRFRQLMRYDRIVTKLSQSNSKAKVITMSSKIYNSQDYLILIIQLIGQPVKYSPLTDQLEAPKTFGDGFAVADILLNSIEEFHMPDDCTWGQVFGCRRCGVKVPQVCRSTCNALADHCLENVYSQSALWTRWVQRWVNY